MYAYGSKDLQEINEAKEEIKAQGDIYRITKTKDGYFHIWDARR